MSIHWDDSLIMGIEEIDNQHKSIVEHFEKLSNAVQDGHGKELLGEMMLFLNDYAQVHFATEDRYMVKYAYPKIDEQRHEHAEFTRDIEELKTRFEQEGGSRDLLIAVTGKMLRWIIQHIRNHDREMGEYVKARMAAENAA